MRTFKAVVFAVALAACGGSKSKPAEAPQEPAPTTTEATGTAETPAETPAATPANDAVAQAALAEQYEVGKKVYVDKKCDKCHGKAGEGGAKSPPVIGEKALPEQAPATSKLRKGVTFKTAKDVLDFVKAKMPMPFSAKEKFVALSDEEAAAVTSWMLSESKVNITTKLDASNAASVNLK